jgi:4'-phosphopantetheinyl transferase
MNPTEWVGFNQDYELPEDEVHVWRTTLAMAAPGFAELLRILSPDERERALRFHFEIDQQRSVIGRGYLRLLLGRILGMPAESLRFESNKFGKPSLVTKHRLLQFNVSHSGELILIAIARRRAVGVDVERIRTDLELDSIAARFFSANECKILNSLVGQARYEAFFACWTRKEAYVKATGLGLSLALDQFDVSLLPHEEPRLLATRNNPLDASQWRLRELDLSSDYVAALAASGSNWDHKCWDWDPLILI